VAEKVQSSWMTEEDQGRHYHRHHHHLEEVQLSLLKIFYLAKKKKWVEASKSYAVMVVQMEEVSNRHLKEEEDHPDHCLDQMGVDRWKTFD
jgi:hypothetical protein